MPAMIDLGAELIRRPPFTSTALTENPNIRPPTSNAFAAFFKSTGMLDSSG